MPLPINRALLGLLVGTYSLGAASMPLSQCLAMASDYYQQVYCEVRAKDAGDTLPPLYQFKNNPLQTQWLLLKRPAEKLGISLRKPQGEPATRPRAVVIAPTPPKATPQRAITASPSTHAAPHSPPHSLDCSHTANLLVCGEARYQLQTNLHNRRLAANALSAENRLTLPAYTGDIHDESAVRRYLYDAYADYLDKMRSIGLGGITTTFGNFSYLFYDYHAQGLDFAARFEQLFHYLKRDKRTLAVSEQQADTSGLQLTQCAPLRQYMICEHQGSNLLFARL